MKWFSILLLATLIAMGSCSDETTETVGVSALRFSVDTLRFDTVFTNTPTATRSFWVYNRSDADVECSSIMLNGGNQQGFLVNVDGIYLGQERGYQVSNLVINRGDSIRVFVALNAPLNGKEMPSAIEDHILFQSTDGHSQRVRLEASGWDAIRLTDLHITRDTVFDTSRPILISRRLTIDEGATLQLSAGTTLYFDHQAGIDVYGTLICDGKPSQPVTLRGSRLDRMFPYLPYDRVSGQWQGIRFRDTSRGSRITGTDLRSAFDGITVDSTSLDHVALQLDNSWIHNCQGYGLKVVHASVKAENTLLTNTLDDCLFLDGGAADFNACTLAQFYPFVGGRGMALRLDASKSPIIFFKMRNSIVTGYADDVLSAKSVDKMSPDILQFANSLIRTPKPMGNDSVFFKNIIFESPDDTIHSGRKQFVVFDTEKFIYDFRLDSLAVSRGIADPSTSPLLDRYGMKRDDKPDAGAYEYIEPNDQK